MKRRESLQLLGAASALAILPEVTFASVQKKAAPFQYCLNTSTINGPKLGVKRSIEIAAKAGYEFVELWIPDIRKYRDGGNTLSSLQKYISDSGLRVANAIGFAPWMVPDNEQRKKGYAQMEDEMNIMAALGSTRIAAAPAGLKTEDAGNLDLITIGQYYKDILDLGRKTGVMPQLEFWGVSPAFFHLGQVMMVAAAANDPDVKILADVFHLFRGGSGFEGMKLIDKNFIEVFHMNDFPSTPREEQKDKDRVFPGDGVAPLKSLLRDLSRAGGPKILSLELFNPVYWEKDPFEIAKTGLEKMKASVKIALQ